jgi:hypothetical protein
MPTPTAPSSGTETPPRSWAGRKPGEPSRIARGTRRRRAPYLVLGVLLVVTCVAGAVITVLQVGKREPVLTLAHPVQVGQVLTRSDLRQVSLSADSGIDLVPASQAGSVLGRRMAYALPAGTLLTRSAQGRPQVPPEGHAIVAVAAKPGQFPPQLARGTAVSVIVSPDSQDGRSSQATVSGGPWPAVVVGVEAPASDQSTVVSLQLPAASARQVAAVPPGELSVVAVAAGGK